jgi:hypothetical protein
VRYRDAAAFRQALEQRLKSRAVGNVTRLARDRKRIVFERLLARLTAAAPGRLLGRIRPGRDRIGKNLASTHGQLALRRAIAGRYSTLRCSLIRAQGL